MESRCPICEKQVCKPSEAKNHTDNIGFFPFCSERCKLVDLSRWFQSEYIISSPIQEQEKDNDNNSENMLE
ncbi:MAG: DNA gyrase inhibitor YacG [Phycisphaerae bacterium]